ncbi:MAG: hypothetical protein ABR537_06815, partial [Gemmatimonadales bacterium]
ITLLTRRDAVAATSPLTAARVAKWPTGCRPRANANTPRVTPDGRLRHGALLSIDSSKPIRAGSAPEGSLMKVRHLAVAAILLLLQIALAGAFEQSAEASAINFGNRINWHLNPYYDGAGAAINGVQGKMYIKTATGPGPVSFQDFLLNASNTSGQQAFVQLGSRSGNVRNGVTCGSESSTNVSTAHFYLVYKHYSDACETHVDLGVWGSTNNYRMMGLRLDTTAGCVIYSLDGARKGCVAGPWPTAWIAGVIGETNDTCTQMYMKAQDPVSPYDTLQFYSSTGGYRYFTGDSSFTVVLYHPSLYSYGHPNGSVTTASASGPSPLPGEC